MLNLLRLRQKTGVLIMFCPLVPGCALFQVSHTELEEHLRSYGVTDCYVTGIATDICVNATAMHSIEIGFRTVLVNDACRYDPKRIP